MRFLVWKGTRSWLTAGAVLLCSHYVTSQPVLRGENRSDKASKLDYTSDMLYNISRMLKTTFYDLETTKDSADNRLLVLGAVVSSLAIAAVAFGMIIWYLYRLAPVMQLSAPWLKHIYIRLLLLNVSALLAEIPSLACSTSAFLFFASAPSLCILIGLVAIKGVIETKRIRIPSKLRTRPLRVPDRFLMLPMYSMDVIVVGFLAAFLVWEADDVNQRIEGFCIHGQEGPNIPISVLYGLTGASCLFALGSSARAYRVLSVGYECFGNFLTIIWLLPLLCLRIAHYAGRGTIFSQTNQMAVANALFIFVLTLVSLIMVLFRKLPYVHMSETSAKENAVVKYGLGLGAMRYFPGGSGLQSMFTPSEEAIARLKIETTFGDPRQPQYDNQRDIPMYNIPRLPSWTPEDGGRDILTEINRKYGYVSDEGLHMGSARGLSPRGDRSKRSLNQLSPNEKSPHPMTPQTPHENISATENEASIRIQAMFRGANARSKLHSVIWRTRSASTSASTNKNGPSSQEDDVDDERNIIERAATRIQATFRGGRARRWLHEMKQEFIAATRIQAIFRGSKSRKKVENLRIRRKSLMEVSGSSGAVASMRSAPAVTHHKDTSDFVKEEEDDYFADVPLKNHATAPGPSKPIAPARSHSPFSFLSGSDEPKSPKSPISPSRFGSRLMNMRIPTVHLPSKKDGRGHKRNQTM